MRALQRVAFTVAGRIDREVLDGLLRKLDTHGHVPLWAHIDFGATGQVVIGTEGPKEKRGEAAEAIDAKTVSLGAI